MNAILNDIIKEGYDIQKGIYPDSGGGLYATYSFKDQNKYLKWIINTTKFIENNFPKDEAYLRFKDIIQAIEEEISIGEFNKLMFVLESYNSSLNKTKTQNFEEKDLLDKLSSYFSDDDMQKIGVLIKGKGDIKPFIDKLSKEKLTDLVVELLK